MRQSDAMIMRGQAALNSTAFRVATQCRVITYLGAVSPFLLMIVLAGVYPNLNRTEVSDWRPLISLADEALIGGDRSEARRLYMQVDRVAYWRKDWEGLVAAACRINKLDSLKQPSPKALSILFRAASTAELAQSGRGLAVVALSLSLLGSGEAASVVLDRSQADWLTDPISSGDLGLLAGCSRSQ